MKTIDTIELNAYTFKNYTILNESEKRTALEFRNKNKSWMINREHINLDEHLKWIDSLKSNETVLYFLVFKDTVPFMSIDYHDIDFNLKEAYWGYFLGDDSYKGEVLKIEKLIIELAFDNLKLNTCVLTI